MDGRMHQRTAAWACRHVQDPVWEKYIEQVSEAGTYPDAYVFGEAAPDKTGWDRWWRELTLIEHEGRVTTIHRVSPGCPHAGGSVPEGLPGGQ